MPSSAFVRAGNERKRQDRTADRGTTALFKVRLDLHDLRRTARSLMSRASRFANTPNASSATSLGASRAFTIGTAIWTRKPLRWTGSRGLSI